MNDTLSAVPKPWCVQVATFLGGALRAAGFHFALNIDVEGEAEFDVRWPGLPHDVRLVLDLMDEEVDAHQAALPQRICAWTLYLPDGAQIPQSFELEFDDQGVLFPEDVGMVLAELKALRTFQQAGRPRGWLRRLWAWLW